jgi:hypothetical protein
VVIPDDQGFVVLGLRDLIIGDDVRSNQIVGSLPRGLIRILEPQHGLDTLKRESFTVELRGVNLKRAPKATHRRTPLSR